MLVSAISKSHLKQNLKLESEWESKNLDSVHLNKSTFYFHDAKERMRVAAKDQLVIESAATYCSKFTTRKLPNATNEKKGKVT